MTLVVEAVHETGVEVFVVAADEEDLQLFPLLPLFSLIKPVEDSGS